MPSHPERTTLDVQRALLSWQFPADSVIASKLLSHEPTPRKLLCLNG